MKIIMWGALLILTAVLVSAESTFLSDYMEEGQTKVYEMEDGVYVISLLSVSDSKEKAVFRLNDEISKGIEEKDSHVFNDGSEVVLRELLLNDASNVSDEAHYYFYGTGKDTLKLSNISKYVLDNNLCNFDKQCINETKEDCCYDCGCHDEEKCENNRCVLNKEKKEEIKPEPIPEKTEETEIQETKPEPEQKDLEIKKEKGEKKVAKIILWIFLAIILSIVLLVIMKRKKRSIF